MNDAARHRVRQFFQAGNGLTATAASVALLALLGAGYGTIPALGRALLPGHGAWRSAAGATLPGSQTLTLAGLTRPARVTFSSQGVPSIRAAAVPDAYLALGYLEARFRLTQLDLERRVAEGQLAALTGSAGVSSDDFELRLGLLRTAQAEWASMPKASLAARVLMAFARGVNDYLATARATGDWPAEFSLAGVYPRNWSPVDSLAVQGELTQELSFTTEPLDAAILQRSLGSARMTAWFGVEPVNQQTPWDPGPYRKRPLQPLPTVSASTVSASTVSASTVSASTVSAGAAGPELSAPGSLATAAAAILAQVRSLPPGQVYTAPASNAWAVSGQRTASGHAMLAGDPHLPQTLPSIWYQAALSAPGLAVSGVAVPGLPAILIGHNQAIAWSVTDTQSQATLFYAEQTSAARPGQYYWRGQWRRMQLLHYRIAVRGGSARQLTVALTAHGPVLTTAGRTVAADWMGALGSPDEAAMLGVDSAASFAQFRGALAGWRSPALTFVYADRQGHIGALAPGYYPQVAAGQPWLPLTGSGADDVAGVVPFAAEPQVYDPHGGIIATANQRPAGPSYPYYLGTSADFFDPGYRAAAAYAYLRGHGSLRPSNAAALQSDVSDSLAAQLVPRLLAALHGMPLTSLQRLAQQSLASWNDQMTVTSGAASIWWTFWGSYLSQVFGPWWTAGRVPVAADPAGLAIGPGQVSLDEDLQQWTLHDQANPAFTAPSTAARAGPAVPAGATPAATAMRAAFVSAVSQLAARLGGGPGRWQWGRLHSRQFRSLTSAPSALGYGPRPANGDPWTVDAAEGGLRSQVGPSWRMIVAWAGTGSVAAQASLPGGQSENPGSPWYADQIRGWWDGSYLPMPSAGPASPASAAGLVSWELRP